MTEKDADHVVPAVQHERCTNGSQPSGATVNPLVSGDRRNTVLENHGYRLGRTIGAGTYAMVKIADSETHAGTVAIKIVSKSHASPDYLQKFLPREIQVVKGLRHPHLIRFLQAIETTHRVYIIMEYAENGSLLDVIRKENYIEEPRSRKWFGQLLDAVEYCHQHEVVHRDIKCENLLIDSQQRIKLSDFGFARGLMGKAENDFVMSETFCGSYAYASPEILKGIPYKPQFSDIWSMGVVLFATVFGRLPFDDSNYKQLLKQVQKPVTFPSTPTVSAECQSLVTKILAPIRSRLKIQEIRQTPWMTKPMEPAVIENNEPQQRPTKTISVGAITSTTLLRQVPLGSPDAINLVSSDTKKKMGGTELGGTPAEQENF